MIISDIMISEKRIIEIETRWCFDSTMLKKEGKKIQLERESNRGVCKVLVFDGIPYIVIANIR